MHNVRIISGFYFSGVRVLFRCSIRIRSEHTKDEASYVCNENKTKVKRKT
jgi:hypothetical protein